MCLVLTLFIPSLKSKNYNFVLFFFWIIGYLVLDQPCTYDSQCLGSPNASCVDGKCSCIKGYSAKDSSVCVSSMVHLSYFNHYSDLQEFFQLYINYTSLRLYIFIYNSILTTIFIPLTIYDYKIELTSNIYNL